MLESLLCFEPHLLPKVWGGRRLSQLNRLLPEDQSYGESWEISDHASHSSVISHGTFAGRTLRNLMQSHRSSLLGDDSEADVFPLLVKFLDADDWLSVQVHPDDENVKTLLPGEGGKTEAWLVLDAEPESKIFAGLKSGVGEKEIRDALKKGNVEECLCTFTPKAGDCLFLPAGTVHAVGGGVLMAEVQQTSDATFRLFDWNRGGRELHLEQSMQAIDWNQGEVKPISIPDFESTGGEHQQISLVDCPYFKMQYRRGSTPFTIGESGQAELLIVLQGEGMIGDQRLSRGTCWLKPACVDTIECAPVNGMGMLHVIIPNNGGAGFEPASERNWPVAK